MSDFTKPLIAEYLDNNTWKIQKEFDYYTDIPYIDNIVYKTRKPYWIFVPKGFITDFASVPRIFQNIFSPYDKYAKAAVIHDYIYKKEEFPRITCDKIFLEAMGVLKVPTWKKYIMYWSVRIFGGSHYGC